MPNVPTFYEAITKIVIQKAFAFFADKPTEFSINLTLDDILDQSRVDFLLEKMYEFGVAERLIVEMSKAKASKTTPKSFRF